MATHTSATTVPASPSGLKFRLDGLEMLVFKAFDAIK
jgi:hypothetical protein